MKLSRLLLWALAPLLAVMLAGGLGAPVLASHGADCGDDAVHISVPLPGGDPCIPKDGPGGPIIAYVKLLIRFLAGIIGILAVLAIVVSSIQYIGAAGNPQAIASAKSRLSQAVIGIVLFILMFGILEILIPGGVFTAPAPPGGGGA